MSMFCLDLNKTLRIKTLCFEMLLDVNRVIRDEFNLKYTGTHLIYPNEKFKHTKCALFFSLIWNWGPNAQK